MITSSLVIYLLAGAIGGLAIGITGAGIGPISIAVMLFLLPLEGLSESSVLHTAIGTSLAIIFVTSLASIMLHHQNKSVNWKLFFLLLPGSVVGAILGSQIAIYLPIDLLKDILVSH